MKKILSVLMAAVIIITMFPAIKSKASYWILSGDYYYVVNNSEAVIAKYMGSDDCVTIPATLDGYPVTAISESSFSTLVPFSHSKNICSVTIPKSVTSIGSEAFYKCTNLSAAYFLGDAPTMSTSVFENCSSVFKVYYFSGKAGFSKNWYGYNTVAESGDYVFDIIDRQVTITGYTGNGGDITVPDSRGGFPVTAIGAYAFNMHTELTGATLPDSVVSLSYSAFGGCSGLKTVNLGSGMKDIGDDSFNGCVSLASVIIPDSTDIIRAGAFYGCSGLKNLKLGNGVTEICCQSFMGCTGLTFVNIPNNVINIGRGYPYIGGAFQGCTSLKSVVIGKGTEYIDSYCFSGCSSLTKAIFLGNEPSTSWSLFSGCKQGFKVYYFSGKMGFSNSWHGYEAVMESSDFEYEFIDDSSVTITRYTGPGGDVVIPSKLAGVTVTGISGYTDYDIYDYFGAFEWCQGLTTVTIPAGVKTIGDNSFESCTGLTSFIVNDYNSYYSSNDGILYNKAKTALLICPEAKTGDIVYPEGLKVISDGAFQSNTVLKNITLPEGLRNIGDGSFLGCTGLVTVKIPNSVTTVGDFAFEGCSKLTSITIGRGVTSFGVNCLGSQHNLTVCCYHDSSAEMYALQKRIPYYCDGLTILQLPDKTTYTAGEPLDLTGMKVLYVDDNLNKLMVSDYSVAGYNPNVIGVQSITVTYNGKTTGFNVTVSGNIIASVHPYQNNADQSYIYNYPLDVDQIGLTFSAETCMEDGYDFIYIYDAGGNLAGKYTGSSLAGKTILVNGNSARIRLTSDSTVNDYGFDMVSVTGFVSDSNFSYSIFNSKVTVLKYIGAGGDVTIPETLSGYPVVAIESGACSDCSDLTSVTIPGSVTIIEAEAFDNCINLKAIIVKNENAFYASENGVLYNKEKTILIDCPEGMTGAFKIPDSVKIIANNAFLCCTGLTDLIIGKSVTSIGQRAFMACFSLTEIIIPESVASLGSQAFSNCYGLTSVAFQNNAVIIGEKVFEVSDNAVVLCFAGSNAETYAIANKIPYFHPYKVTFNNQGGSDINTKWVKPGAAISAPLTPGQTGFIFAGWYCESTYTNLWNFGTNTVNKDTTLYARWISTESILQQTSGSTLVIDNTNHLIFGLDRGIISLDNCLVPGAGDIVYAPTSSGFGTGTKVKVVANNIILAEYTVVYFGDVNGDNNIDSIDAGRIVDVENYAVSWDAISDAALYKAGDLNGDGNIDSIDAGLLVDVQNYMMYIDQATGLAKPY